MIQEFGNRIRTNTRQWAVAFFTWRNILVFILFLLIATLMWYVHALNSIRERTINISVVYTGIPEQIAFETALPDKVTVRLRDSGKRLIAYSDIFSKPMEFDLSEQIHKEGSVYISADQIRPRINDQLQGTTKLQEVMPEAITARYYTESQKTVDVVFAGKLKAAQQYEIDGDATVNPAKIKIFGQKSTLGNIKQVLTAEVDIEGIKDTVTQTVALQPLESVRFSQQSVEVTASASQYTERVFTCPVVAEGLGYGQTMRLFPATAEVRVKVDLSHYNDVDPDKLKVFCTYNKNDDSRKLKLHASSSQEFVKVVRLNPTDIEYLIERK